MNYNINIREEIFGATVSFVKSGKREYVNKDELQKILDNNVFPNDMRKYLNNDECYIKLVSLNDKSISNQFSFADIVYLELTRECNLRCTHCLNNSGKIMENQLNLEEFKELIKNLSEAGIQ